jgi:hypothetical protein
MQVLRGCPWLTPRPMFVLALRHGLSFEASHHFYSLSTRMAAMDNMAVAGGGLGVSDELGMVRRFCGGTLTVVGGMQSFH